jgi:adenylate cyclase
MPSRGSAPLGSRLLGRDTDSPLVVRLRVQTLLTASVVLSNVIGAVVVTALVTFVIPGPSLFTDDLLVVNAVVLPAYVVAALGVGITSGTVRSLRVLRWSIEERDPTPEDRAATLAVPARLTRMQAALWVLAGFVFTPLYGREDAQNVPRVAFTVLLGGLVVCGYSYLLTEFALRPVAAKALTAGALPRRWAGVRVRSLIVWAVGCAIPVAGLMLVAVFSLVRGDVTASRLAVTVLGLGGVTLTFGLLLTWIGLSATVTPIRLVRAGLADVGAGRLDRRVVVFDGTELGELQAGFNRMAQGLEEREQLRDLFGRHVGEEVAAAALRGSPQLGGEERQVAVFFIDLIGSTGLAAARPPAEVVGLLNRFFSVVVDVVEEHGGFINKFEGDGALAVFGAPADLEDTAGKALAAARCVQTRLTSELPECEAAIGVAAGRAVAGNVGHERRFEYTVIGDPVNEAARLCELAKTTPGRLIASASAVATASDEEQSRWQLGESVVLRGRDAPSQLATVCPG